MIFTPTNLQGCFVVTISPISDNRGWFGRYFCSDEFANIGHTKEWLQLNHSFTEKKGTIRGMHFQKPPHQEVKLVRCIHGIIFDVVIDLRKESSTFLHWFSIELSAENRKMIYIPEGFAHGFQTLSDKCELLYHHSAQYQPGSEGGIKYDDPLVNIKWPMPLSNISDRDISYELLDNSFKGISL